ncbi:uncharacterized protein LOC144440314 isoform X2 [Glandiceps talaboti]
MTRNIVCIRLVQILLLYTLLCTVQASLLGNRGDVIGRRFKRDSTYKFSKTCYEEYGEKAKYACDDGRGCFGDRIICDGFENCADGSDEYGCLGIEPPELPPWNLEEPKDGKPYYFPRCQEVFPETEMKCVGEDMCISFKAICNGYDDCQDGADEQDCGRKAYEFSKICFEEYGIKGQYSCADGRGCFGDHVICDGFNNCPDGSDEYGCLGIEPSELDKPKEKGYQFSQTCFDEYGVKGQYSCADGSGCFGQEVICDDFKNCPDGSDEHGCYS